MVIVLHNCMVIGYTVSVALMMLYQLDNTRTNPYDIWQKAGKPVYPSYALLAQMRNAIV